MDELSNDLLKSRVRAKSLVDAVTERLEAAILGGELAPGSRLSEQRLATAFGVSRGPLREAIRRLDGPTPEALLKLRSRLQGGAAYLERMRPPDDLKTTHDLLIGAWRFAENAVSERYAAARAGDVPAAWRASSAAGGALLLLSRVQQEIRELLEPPRLQ